MRDTTNIYLYTYNIILVHIKIVEFQNIKIVEIKIVESNNSTNDLCRFKNYYNVRVLPVTLKKKVGYNRKLSWSLQ